MDTYRVSYHGYAHSHIDALCHILYKDQTYNGYARADVNTEKGCTKLGIDNLKQGVVTRGILIDIPRLKGVPYLEPGTPIYSGRSRGVGEEGRREDRRRATPCCCAPAAGRGATKVGPWPVGAERRRVPRLDRALAQGARRGVRRQRRRVRKWCRRWSRASALPVHTLMITALGINMLDNQDLERSPRRRPG